MKTIFVRILGLSLLAIFCVSLKTASAGVGLQPGHPDANVPLSDVYFVYPKATPGDEYHDFVVVRNQTDQTKTYSIEAYDGLALDGGGFSFVGTPADNVDIGTWVTLEKNEVTLGPNADTQVPFTVKVPLDAYPGDHAGVIAAVEKQPDIGPGGVTGMKIVSRIGIRMYATVPGDIKVSLKVQKVNHSYKNGHINLQLSMENNGNIRLSPHINVALKSLTADYGKQDDIKGSSQVFPNKVAVSSMEWPERVPAFGRYVATFDINYRDNRTQFSDTSPDAYKVHYEYVFWLVPWGILAWIAVVLLGILLLWLIWRWFSIVNRKRMPTEIYQVKAGDTLGSVAAKHDISAKTLVRFNALAWPFELKPGEYLLVPIMGAPKKSFLAGIKDSFKRKPRAQKAVSKNSMADLPPTVVAKMVPPVDTEALVVEDGDTIEDVAAFAGVSILTIAKINGLKAPFELKEGQELFVPKASKTIAVAKPSKPKASSKKVKVAPKTRTVSKAVDIEKLELAPRVEAALKKARLKTISDLEKKGSGLAKVKGVGPKAFLEIKRKLKKQGITI
jgi:LysM repeat protein